MALDMNDIMALKSLENGMSPYEQVKIGNMQSKSRTSGVGIAGLATGIGGVLIAGTAWLYAHSQAKKAQEVAAAKNDGLRDLVFANKTNTDATLDRLARTLERETDARVSGDINLTTTINDTVSGQQQGTQNTSVAQEVTQQVMTGLMTGRYSENPQRVTIWRDAQACDCPCGCGCGR